MNERPMKETNGNSEVELTFIDETYPKIKIYDHVMRVLGRNLDDCPRRPKDYFFKVPKVFRLPVYENEEISGEDVRDVGKALHDHYAYTYWVTALQKLQMFRGERDDPVDLSTTRKIEKSSDGDSGQGDYDTLETKYDRCRRLSAIVRSDSSSGCPSPVEPNHSFNFRSRKRRKVLFTSPRKRTKRRRRRRPMVEGDISDRRSSPKPRLKLCRYFSTKFRSWRKSVRKRKELQVYRDRRSTSSSDPDSGTNLPIVRKVVNHKKKDRLVSEGTMLNVVNHIPYKLLDFHPEASKLPYMELSLKGIGGALYQIGQLMTFYRKVARDMCLDVAHPRSSSRVSKSLTKEIMIFLAEMNIFFEILFPTALLFLASEGTALRKLKLWSFYKDRFAKQWQELNLSLYLVLFDGDPVAEQRKSELASYYKAICTLKVSRSVLTCDNWLSS